MTFANRAFAAVLSCAALITGCSHAPPIERRLEAAERQFDTDGPITSLYHSALYYPAEISLRWDGFIVGVEKSPRALIGANKVDLQMPADADAETIKDILNKLDDGKFMFVSHIMENKATAGGLDNCAIYSVYGARNGPAPCALSAAPPDKPEEALSKSWTALETLHARIDAQVKTGRYSAIVVLSMGWNTVQEEAVRNFNSIIGGMKANDPSFNPLVIGVTWPSQWNSPWADPVLKVASFGTKADDADEVGLTWLGVVLHDVLPTSRGSLPVIAIGHSFGARAVATAACIGPVIASAAHTPRRQPVHHVIALQGAFLVDQLLGGNSRGLTYPPACPNVGNFVLTSSRYDRAVTLPFWGVYAGSADGYKAGCGPDPRIRCSCADAKGDIAAASGAPASNILYVNADLLITHNAYSTGGGAHSDVYRREHGRLMLNTMTKNFIGPVCSSPP